MMDIIKNNFIIRSLKEFDLWSMLLIFSIVILGLGYGGYWGYSYYRSSIEQKAQQSFSECMHVYRNALAGWQGQDSSKKNMNAWKEVEIAARLGYEHNFYSYLAPYFLMFQADALRYQGQHSQAVKILDDAMSKISYQPFKKLFGIKRALMLMDSQATFDNGFDQLKELATGEKHDFQDMALFYLGSYYLSRNDSTHAREFFNKLTHDFLKDQKEETRSVWALQAEALGYGS